jgi:hypothetical protein
MYSCCTILYQHKAPHRCRECSAALPWVWSRLHNSITHDPWGFVGWAEGLPDSGRRLILSAGILCGDVSLRVGWQCPRDRIPSLSTSSIYLSSGTSRLPRKNIMSFDSSLDILTLSSPASYVQSLWRLPSRVSSRQTLALEAEEKFYDASETWESASERDSDNLPTCSLQRTLSEYRDTLLKSAQNAGSWAKQSFWDPVALPETSISEVQRLQEKYRVVPGDWPDTRHEVIRQEKELSSLRNRISALESRTVTGMLTETAVSAARSYLTARTPLGRFLQPEEASVAVQQEREGSVRTEMNSTRSLADIVRRQSTLAWETYRTTKQTAVDLAAWTYRTVADVSTRIWGTIATHAGWTSASQPDQPELVQTASCRNDGGSTKRSNRLDLGIEEGGSRSSECRMRCTRDGADTNDRRRFSAT